MPLKSYLLASLYLLVGGGVFLFLGLRFVKALRSVSRFAKVRECFFLVLALSLTLAICSQFLPCFNLMHRAYCRGPSEEKWIALTFDDGPREPTTSQVLDILKAEGIHATFFLVGENIEKSPQSVLRMAEEGHVIGNHTLDHTPLVFLKPSKILDEIEGCETKMPVPLSSVKLFRAPRGWKSPFLNSILREKGYRLIGWTRGVWDTDDPDAETLFRRMTEKISPGEIILLHDGLNPRKEGETVSLVQVLPRAIERYKSLGYRFVTLPEMLEKSRAEGRIAQEGHL